jgi:hypothetical protein
MRHLDRTMLVLLRAESCFDAASDPDGAALLDDATLDKIVILVDVPPANRENFKREVSIIVRNVRYMATSPTLEERWNSYKRKNVVRRLDNLISALDGLLFPGGEVMAAGFFFAGEPQNGTEAIEAGYLGQRFILELRDKAQRAREIATKTGWLYERGGPRRTRGSPALDCFLMDFLGAADYFGARRLTASKSQRKTGTAVTGTIISVLHLVAPHIHPNFLAYSSTSILYAINRWRRATKMNCETFPRELFGWQFEWRRGEERAHSSNNSSKSA